MPAKEIPISKPSRIIKQQAEATIQSLIDAVVELVTNSDDSYSRLENAGIPTSGRINIYVNRESGGKCKKCIIRDFAEGMSKKQLEKAISYGEDSSQFIEGKKVRGLLGRGLKESILGLGEGEIYTKKKDEINGARIWWDEKKRKALYEFFDDFDRNDADIKEFLNSRDNGTLIRIYVHNDKIKIPEQERFALQISNHYALRNINSSKNRKINLEFEDLKRKLKSSIPIQFTPPLGNLVINKTFSLPKYNDPIRIQIWESSASLTSGPVRYDPFSQAGILIETENTILDNQLFKYDNNPAAYYFFGKASCDGIASYLRKVAKQSKESDIIDLTRKGLNWRSSYCQIIEKIIEDQLDPLIRRKTKELESDNKTEMSHNTKKILSNLCRLLDNLAREEFEEWEGPMDKDFPILTIVPSFANIEVDKSRSLSIYAPKELIEKAGTTALVQSDNINVKIIFPGTNRMGLSWEIDLKQHPKKSELYYAFFKVIGKEINTEAFISCKLGHQETGAIIKVVPQIEKKELKKMHKRKKGGFISDIISDSTPNPIQRVQYIKERGEIKIFIQFPSVQRYLSADLKEIESREDSRAILAELIGEAFCRVLAKEKLNTGAIIIGPGLEGQIDAFNTEVSNMQKKYLDKIHALILNQKKTK